LIASGAPSQQFPLGRWYPAYNWALATTPTLNLIHVGVIPRGPHQGKIVFLTWDRPSLTSWASASWGIIDPDAQGAAPTSPPPLATFVHVGTNGPVTMPGGPTSPGIPGWEEAPCCGQSWTPDGRWFLAGGNQNPSGPPVPHTDVGPNVQYFGSRRAWIYDPDVVSLGGPAVGDWFAQPDLFRARYYPTVLLTQIDNAALAPFGEMIVAGGSADWFNGSPYQYPNQFWDHYETFRPGARGWPSPTVGTWVTVTGQPSGSRLFPGPTIPGANGASPTFNWYPRLFLLSDGRMANLSTNAQTSWAIHPTSSAASWTNIGARVARGYGPALLFPNATALLGSTGVNIAGISRTPGPGGTIIQGTTNVEWANLAAPAAGAWPGGHSWTFSGPSALPQLNIARDECNAVILPTGEIMVLGDGSDAMVRTPELLTGGLWAQLPQEASRRDHHATAILLPSGRVFSASGNRRTFDFQVYEPAYMSMGTRPTWVTTPGGGVLNRGQTLTVPITLPPGAAVGKVVLMRPGSLTHHADMDQRYVQLKIIPPDPEDDANLNGFVTFETPVGPPSAGPGVKAPVGHYMIFLVTSTGIPSVAKFVRFQ
jgi:hypothetical protein